MTATSPVGKYLEAMSASFEILAEAGSKASERGARLSKKFADQAMASQRDALALAKKVADDPEHMLSASYSSFTESAVAAQTRTLAFAQLMYQEVLESSGEAREFSEKLAEANKETAAAATELSRNWASMSPFTEMLARSMDAGIDAVAAKPAKGR